MAKSGFQAARLVRRDLALHPSMLLAHSYMVPRAAGGSVSTATASKPVEALLQGYKAASWFCFAASVLSIVVALARLSRSVLSAGWRARWRTALDRVRLSRAGTSSRLSSLLTTARMLNLDDKLVLELCTTRFIYL